MWEVIGVISWSLGWFLVGFGLGWAFADYLRERSLKKEWLV